VSFHRRRWRLLAGAGADLLACETLPARAEVRALRRLLESGPEVRAWFSFSCRDGFRLRDGSRLSEVVSELADCPRIVAIGVNCTAPRFVSSLIGEVRSATTKPIVVYPNSGEGWDPEQRRWLAAPEPSPTLADAAPHWRRLGARLIGGCCRTGPGDIAALRRRLLGSTTSEPARPVL
jgi:homocysteine S-methyltransferase